MCSTCPLLFEFLVIFLHKAHTQSLTSVRELDTTYGSIGVSINSIHFTLLTIMPTHFVIAGHTFIDDAYKIPYKVSSSHTSKLF